VSFQVAYAEKVGYFKDVNLTVKFQNLAGDAAVSPLLFSGQVDIAALTMGTVFSAQASGAKSCVIGTVQNIIPGVHVLFVKPDSPIHSIADLKGKKIAVGQLGGFYSLSMTLLLKTAGLTLDDVKLVEVGLPDMSAVLDRGDVDVGVFSGSFQAAMRARYPTFRKVADLTEAPELSGLLQQGLIVTPGYKKDHADIIARFLDAVGHAAKDLDADDKLNVEQQVVLQPNLDASAAQFVVPRHTYKAPASAADIQRGIDLTVANGQPLPGVDGQSLLCNS
jgi:NitT/TauT family transport system substrate-binding protein